uniref:Uncharacterized LOC114645494 n=1 Tax=Erpetoichthys calabaricus TaxID=27687 RepID=A0A8C4RVR7_ERPCA
MNIAMNVLLDSLLAAPRGNWLFITGTISSSEAVGKSMLLLLLALSILNSSQATDFKYMGSSLSLEIPTGKAIPELIVYYRSLALSPCPPVTQGMCQVLNCTSVAQQSSTKYSGWCLNQGQAVIPMSNSSTLQIRISNFTILGPPGLQNSSLWFDKRQDFDVTSANVSWTRITVYQPIYISVCFSATIDRFQLVPRCIWIQQIPSGAPPPGSAIQCLETEMKFILARTTLPNIHEHDLQLNDPSCSIIGNATHFLLDIPLLGCGTKIQVEDAYFVFINTLMTRTLYGVITRLPTLRLPIACHYQSMGNVGNNMNVSTFISDKAFGNFSIHVEFKHSSLSRSSTGLIQSPLRVASNEILYLYVFANTPVPKVDLIVQSCWTSEVNNATTGNTFIKQGCVQEGIVQLVSDESLEKIYKINLGAILNLVSEVYVQCIVQLCLNIDSTMNCSSGCLSNNTVQFNPMSREYHVSSGLISLIQSSTIGATTTLLSSPPTQRQLAASYVAIIIGTVIGCTVTLVVALLVMKSFQGVTYRRIHHLVRDRFSSSGSWSPQQFTNI